MKKWREDPSWDSVFYILHGSINHKRKAWCLPKQTLCFWILLSAIVHDQSSAADVPGGPLQSTLVMDSYNLLRGCDRIVWAWFGIFIRKKS